MKELFKLLNVSKLLKDSHFKKLENERSLKDDRLLQKFESKTYSQNGEDGILTEIFSRIGTDSKYFVEFGIQDGTENCTRNLLENGWSGLWIEADKKSHDAAKEKFKDFNILLINDFITIKNINSLFEKAKVPNNLDLLVIDIDGNDYWIWNEITEYSPKVICMEYNGSYSPNKSWIMPYNATHEWNGSNNFGASLESYTELGFKKGYYLVGCDSQGLNAFFVRKDLVKDNFSNIFEKNNSYHYSYPKYNPYFFGHPKPFVISIIKKLNKLGI